LACHNAEILGALEGNREAAGRNEAAVLDARKTAMIHGQI
jgi:hypothetical protein